MPLDTVRLRDADTWVFDLDNTLYPPSFDLFDQIDIRMRDYIAAFLGLAEDEAYKVQKDYFFEFGTSLRGLMDRHGMDPEPFLDHVHAIDITVLPPDPSLEAALRALPGRKLIYTNASTRHAERVVDRLGIGHHFDAIFDIVAADYEPKPQPRPYQDMVRRYGIDPRASVMVEDIPRNLGPAADLGMATVWVRGDTKDHRSKVDGVTIDHVVDDLTAWLEDVVRDRV